MTSEEAPSARLRTELSFLGDTAIEAARTGQVGRLEEALGVLAILVETFLEELVRLGGGYTRQSAHKELHSLEGGWNEMEWVGETYRGVLNAVLGAGDVAVLDDVVAFPHRLSRLAIRYNDQYVFQEFLRWVPYSYWAARSGGENTRRIVASVSGRQLAETLQWFIRPELDAADEAPEGALDYAFVIFAEFNELLKLAQDSGLESDYCDFAGELSWGTDQLRSIGHVADDEFGSGLEARIREAIQVLALGQAAWLTHRLEEDELTPASWSRMKECLPLTSEIPALWQAYRTAREETWGELFRWRSWELEEAPRGMVIGIPTDFRLSLAVLIESLRLMPAAAELGLPDFDEFRHWSKSDSDVGLALSRLEESSTLRAAAGDATTDKLTELRKAIARVGERAEAKEASQIAAAPVSPRRVRSVAASIQEGWRETSRFRGLFEEHGLIQHLGPYSGFEDAFGVSNWDLKELYVDDPPGNWHTKDWGSEYGRSLGAGEDERVFKALTADQGVNEHDVSTPDDVRQAIDSGVAEVHRRGSTELAIALNGSWYGFLAVTEAADFVPRESGEVNRWTPYLGRYKDCPVVNLLGSVDDLLIVFDLARSFEWKQYAPPTNRTHFTHREILADAVSFEVLDVDEEEARELVEERGLFRRRGSEELSLEEALRELKTRVFVRVWEWFEFEVREKDLIWVATGPEI